MQQLNRSSHRINVMNRSLLLVFLLLLFVSCEHAYDPFEGGKGVRMNMNGKKCVMVARSDRQVYVYNNKDGYGQTLSFSAKMGWQDTQFAFRLRISDPDTLIQGYTYPAKARIGSDQDGVSLEGFAEIVTLNPMSLDIEALFEFTGGNLKESYVVKHGYFRLEEYGKSNENDPEEEYQQ